MEQRLCLTCGAPLKGRSDKRYCDDACRNAYNNKLNSIPNNFVRRVNGILKKNRRILEELLGEERMLKIPREKLLSKGLNFDFFTSQLANAKGQIYFFVYEYGYLPLDQDVFLLVRQKL
ncbi:hypothetical protein BC792_102254 [Sphingobacterium allocomposti]|jgi:hypothetical protein|uniref:DUF2116 family Zn-ribbon domain-containing protein n=1 Tax=Sphingobacterium allocomposti TaxID=415956 RepID=A0A5S5DPL9_9SPHI|nr:hypothetical protein [Sphingobacterium composti Yoo et al. 2007 non Ten et al. 2007]TYP97831.1 hypothetical protein BC792_102254 [Sphingobacterium composti Yoo et al. 2007 non Ten et al. 2007]HLS96393.1 hypothetical protein [Sphingobacterium sp.]